MRKIARTAFCFDPGAILPAQGSFEVAKKILTLAKVIFQGKSCSFEASNCKLTLRHGM